MIGHLEQTGVGNSVGDWQLQQGVERVPAFAHLMHQLDDLAATTAKLASQAEEVACRLVGPSVPPGNEQTKAQSPPAQPAQDVVNAQQQAADKIDYHLTRLSGALSRIGDELP